MMDILNVPKEAFEILAYVMLGAACALHLLSAILKENIAKILQYVNVALHIFAFCVLMLAEVKIETAVLFYMASTFFAALVSYVGFEIEKRRGEGESK